MPRMTLAELLARTGVSKVYLRIALTHRSWLNESDGFAKKYDDNERLELLGDAVLDLVAAEFLYRSFPKMREGELTALRAEVVKGETLARFAIDLGLPPHLLLSRGEDRTGARMRRPILASAYEAVIGALYLDRGLEAARDLALEFIAPAIERIDRERRSVIDAKSRLQEEAQGRWNVTPRYRVVDSHGPDHAKTFVMAVFLGQDEWGRGEGRTKKDAEEYAAQDALRRVAILPAEVAA